jgi:hemolysin III
MMSPEVYMSWLKESKHQTRAEEIGNATTHALGALLSIVALSLLILFNLNQNNEIKFISSIVFGCALLLMYLSSTIYHSLRDPKLKHFFRIVDHSSIYLLIASSYTPFMLVTIHGVVGWTLFFIIWSLGVAGVIFKLFFVHRFEIFSTVIYLMMGWLAIVVAKPIYLSLPAGGLFCIVAGGLCYTVGVIFYAWEHLKFSHMLWHLFVLAGSIFHFFAVLLYVVID